MSASNRKFKPNARLIASTAAVIVLLVVVAAIMFGLSKQAEYERRSYERSGEYTSYIYGPAYNACVRLLSGSQSDCIAEANNKRHENTRNENDLVAQQTMSIWTFLMGCAAVIGMLLSAVGVYLVFSTFQETRRTADAAVDAGRQSAMTAQAAIDANELNRTAMLIDQRPWVSFRHLDIGLVGNENDVRAVRFNFVWANTGKTPAVRSFCLTNESSMFKGERADDGDLTIIGPGLTFMSADQNFSPERVFSSRDGEPIRLRSVIQYGSNETLGSSYVTDYTIDIVYIGIAGLEEIMAGKINPGNFWVGTRGAPTDKMT